MKKPKESRSLGILTKKETDFINMSEEKRKETYGEGSRKYYQRIIESANIGLQDYSIIIKHLPKEYLKKVCFLTGLRNIKDDLRKVGESEQIPNDMVDDVLANISTCLELIGNENIKLQKIAKHDFDKVKEWLFMLQKQPKSKGPSFEI